MSEPEQQQALQPLRLEQSASTGEPGPVNDSRGDLQAVCGRLKAELSQAIVGQEQVVELLLIALLARGHALFQGVPGLAKTLLIRSLAAVSSTRFSRIQFTPDLLPSDITGTEVFRPAESGGDRRSSFVEGPVFANLILADEINRASPKTQAALLEAMAEGEVTVLGRSMQLPAPFAVFATQNPIEHEGTYPLPEAQLDRFMFQVEVSYPDRDQELVIVEQTTGQGAPKLRPQLDVETLLQLQDRVRMTPAGPEMVAFAVALARASRPGPDAPDFIQRWVSWGAGPRASQFLILGAKARALMHGRNAVSRQDLRALAVPVLVHRILLNFKAKAEGVTAASIVEQLLDSVDGPEHL
ncbi:MAG: AAA family ATPase [Rickettsiales bacterium]|nr:AAA family ATPase [Rickettsiales bacterium]